VAKLELQTLLNVSETRKKVAMRRLAGLSMDPRSGIDPFAVL
jgi:hypothetical protein